MKADSAGSSPNPGKNHDPEVLRISLNLGSFRPSEREEVETLMRNDGGRRIVAAAVAAHLDGWKQGDWLDEPYVERLGSWFGRKAPSVFLSRLVTIAADDPHRAHVAFLKGVRDSSHKTRGIVSSEQTVLAAAV